MLYINLVAYQIDLYYAWQKAFQSIPNVMVVDGDILQQSADALVSPANSFGYMDGGLDLKISETLGWHIEDQVREVLLKNHYGELPVGQAIIVPTHHTQFTYLISAPTMRVPMDVSNTVNAYLAFKAILQAVEHFNHKNPYAIKSIACPGLGTGEGKMPALLCAKQMRAAYDVVMNKQVLTEGGLASAVRNHMHLIGEQA